jgi:hypothetical protein
MIRLFLALLLPLSVFGQSPQRKALMVIVDGIPADLLERTPHPQLAAIAEAGAYRRAYVGGEKGGYTQTPTVSAVSYNSMLTGTWVNKHNVWNNSITDPNYHYPTIFRLVRTLAPEKKLGIYSTWTDNRTKLLGEGLPETGGLSLDYKIDGFELDKVRFPHDQQSDYINKIDEEVVRQASLSLRQDAPDLSWVYLQYTDDVGHALGDSEKMKGAIEKMDRQMGELYQALKYREQYHGEEWLMVVVTDHGRDIVTGRNHGGQSQRERTSWMVTNSRELNPYFFVYTPAIVDIFPSVARHLGVKIPETFAFELDGVPFVGALSLVDPQVKRVGDKLRIEWTPMAADGELKIHCALENAFEKTGRADQYRELGKVALTKGRVELDLTDDLRKAPLLKVVLEGEKNTVNRWLIRAQ